MVESLVRANPLVQDFIDVSVEVMDTMASYAIKPTRVVEPDVGRGEKLEVTACLDITGILGFSGGRKGSILVTFSKESALSAVGGMLGMEFTEMDADVRDGIGELVNMIAGGAKTKLQAKGIDFILSIPNTVIGPKHQITAPASTSRTRIDFETPDGEFFVEVYLKEEK
jgi:chemotaxis protein CheX